MAYLRVEHGEGGPFEVELGADVLTIGRGTANDLHFRNPWLSRVHAEIRRRGDTYYLADVGSRNGTFLNGHPLHGEAPLGSGDLIALGDIRLRFLTSTGALKVSDEDRPLTQEGTVILSSEDLLFGRYRERPAAADSDSATSLLPALNAAASELIVYYPLDELLERVLQLVVEPASAERGALLLRSREGEAGELEIKAVHGYADGEEVSISRTIIDEVLGNKKAILTLDARSDDRFERAESIMMQGIRSVICVPLWNNREVIGLIYLDHRLAGDIFDEAKLRLVGLIGNMAAVKIENAYLLEAYLEKQRMEEQLAIGAQIQRQLLPAADPRLEGYEICAAYQSCFEIGGDYYDYISLPGGKLAVVVGDISGKGVGAALLMAVLQASLRALIHTETEPAALVARLNQVLVESSPYNKFATLFYAELDPARHRLEYVNGGHTPGLLALGGEVEELGSTGPIVGIMPEARFTSRRIDLEPGHTLLLYTDGIVESTDSEGEELGTERLHALLTAAPAATGGQIIDGVRVLVGDFRDAERLDDDSTLVVVRRLAEGELVEGADESADESADRPGTLPVRPGDLEPGAAGPSLLR